MGLAATSRAEAHGRSQPCCESKPFDRRPGAGAPARWHLVPGNGIVPLLKTQGLIIEILFFVFSAEAANATGFRCPRTGSYVEEGQSTAEVESACGPPATKEHRKGAKGRVTDRWTYDLGPGYFVQILLFLNERLVMIEDGEYGQSR